MHNALVGGLTNVPCSTYPKADAPLVADKCQIPTNATQREGAGRQGLVPDRLRDLVLAAFHANVCTMLNELSRRDVLIGAATTAAAAVLPIAVDADEIDPDWAEARASAVHQIAREMRASA